MKLYVILAIAGLTTGFSVRAIAQEKEPSLTEQDREQIVAVGKTNDEAWSKSDAVALAALFTDDAIFVTPGATFSGREAIEKRYQDVFQGLKKKLGSDLSPEGKHITNVTKNVEIHALDDNAVWGVGEWSQLIPGPNDTVKELHGSYGCVTVRVGDSWKNRMLVAHASGQRSSLTARRCSDTVSNSPVRKSPKRVWVMQGCANRQSAVGAPTERKQAAVP